MTTALFVLGCLLLIALLACWVRVWIKQRNATPVWPDDGLDDDWHDRDDFLGI